MREPTPILQNLLLFPRALRQMGVSIAPEQSRSFLRAFRWLDLRDRRQIYHGGKALLITRKVDLPLYDTLFHRFFRPPGTPLPRGEEKRPRGSQPPSPERFTIANYMAVKAKLFREMEEEINVLDRAQTWSAEELLGNKDFAAMTEEELAAVRRMIQELRFQPCQRRSRRQRRAPRGAHLDLRRTLRTAAAYGGTPLKLHHRSRKIQERPLVLLADISGSMEKYSRLLLQLFYSLSHSFRRVESFLFGTRLTRITPQLALRNIDRAIDGSARQALDWSGGTRIGESLGEFNRRFARRVLRRGAVVLIISDGWERGDTEQLKKEMRFLQHRCHRLIWLNPHLGREGYEPQVEGMVAALPHVDDFLPVHNLDSLAALGEHLARL